MKRSTYRASTLAALVLAGTLPGASALAVELDFHGDLNNRFKAFSNQRDFFAGGGSGGGLVRDDGVNDNFAEIKYRFWVETATDNNEVRGVFATEIGGTRFGEGGDGDFSGDGTNIETRWAYLDFGMPQNLDHRVLVGLQPIDINQHVWNETVTGVMFTGPVADSLVDYEFLWGRGDEASTGDDPNEAQDDGFSGADNFALKFSGSNSDGLSAEAFVLYQRNDQTSEGTGVIDATAYQIKSIADNSKYNILTLGGTGGYETETDAGRLFLDWTGMYQTGEIEDMAFLPANGPATAAQTWDLQAYFLRGDAGIDFGATKLTYTIYYSSGDDDPNDGDLDAFIATDVDASDSLILQDNFADDDTFAETHYLLDKGFFMNKVQLDHKVSSRLKVSGMLLYNALAEEVDLTDGSDSRKIGFELGSRVSYMLYENLELAGEAAYLFGDDAMDTFEEAAIQDGDSDQDILHLAGRIRYKF